MNGICAIDLDTILPVLFISKIKRIDRLYDAHEYFTELKEVRTRAFIKNVWKWIGRFAVPKFKYGYTVSNGLAEEFKKEYGRQYIVIRNLPILKPLPDKDKQENVLIYQGAVNEARGFEYLVPAMEEIPFRLVVCGDGNFMLKLKNLIKNHQLEDKIELKGMLPPDRLWAETVKGRLGMTLAEKEGLNQYLALPNKFFEYMHAGLPQIAMNYPEYASINNEYRVAVLLDELSIERIIKAVKETMSDERLLEEMRSSCLRAREIFNWQQEEKHLVGFYHSIFGGPI
jgi:glycosyltransferase involved in cell wall biosynthesis